MDEKKNRRILSETGLKRQGTISTAKEAIHSAEDGWRFFYDHLLAYIEEHNGKYPTDKEKYKGLPLGRWTSNQIYSWRSGKISGYRKEALLRLPNWNAQIATRAEDWEENYKALAEYLKVNNDKYPSTREKYKGLAVGRWTANQIHSWRVGEIRESKKEALSKLPNWDARIAARASDNEIGGIWEGNYKALVEYIEEHDGKYPSRNERHNGYSVGNWLCKQAGALKTGKLKQRRRAALEMLPNWQNRKCRKCNAITPQQEVLAMRLRAFKKAFGKTPSAIYVCEDGYCLGSKLCFIRQKYKKGELSPDVIRIFEESGMAWEKHGREGAHFFEQSVSELEEYKRTFGDLDIIQTYVAPSGYRLGAFVNKLRYKRKKGLLSTDQLRQLDELGMIWTKVSPGIRKNLPTNQERLWKEKYQALAGYLEENNGKYPPYEEMYKEFSLGSWTASQIHSWRTGKIKKSKREALSKLPNWDTRIAARASGNEIGGIWQENYKALVKYIEEHNGIYPSHKEKYNGHSVGNWLFKQVEDLKTGKLKPIREAALEKLPDWGNRKYRENSDLAARRKILATRLKDFIRTFGQMPPTHYVCEDGYCLGSKLCFIRRKYKKGELLPDVIHLFEESGISWEAHDKRKSLTFEESLFELEAYKKAFGDIDVIPTYVAPSGYRLGTFIGRLRLQQIKGLLSKERIEQLDKMGMIWAKAFPGNHGVNAKK